MRILQLAPLWETVPPPGYGGTEAVVSILCEELVRRGVDVTLCASGDSLTSARLQSVYDRSLGRADDLEDPSPYHWMHAALSLRGAEGYDLVHNHAGELAMAMSHLVDAPMLTTMHNGITQDTQFVWDHYEGWYNTISHAQRASMPMTRSGKFVGVVQNAIDVESFPFSSQKDEYLLFLSRISSGKGAHLAIEAARRLGRRLIIAGKVDRVDRAYYDEAVQPLIDGEQVVFFGEADACAKRELYQRAYCLLLPLCWEEPFGLVMTEAMACGTPVVAFARGAAPEIVVDGETGYLVEDVDGMVEAVRNVDRIDPARCRQHVSDRFSPQVMAERYLASYRTILDRTARQRPLVLPPTRVAPLPAVGATGDGETVALS
ncbi:MAG: glycosyltransferase family 4 protein [Chloroflexi bacterium]|nr:glycosyltransferase family 4 protein [Chloroflexota bacterium]